MTTYQTGANFSVALHPETGINVQATATGATFMRIIASDGLKLDRAPIQSAEKRPDGETPMGRLGYKTVSGSYNHEATIGGATDILIAAIKRAAFVTTYSIPFSSLTTVALTTNALTASGGSWLAAGTQGGIKVGDIFSLSGTTVAADNNLNTQVLAVTTLTLTVLPGTFTTLTATATGTMVMAKKIKTGTTPTRQSFSIEQADNDIDASELFTGNRLIGLKLSYKPGADVAMTSTWQGVDRQQLTGVSSPYFTTPSATTGLALVADDSVIVYNGTKVANFTGFDLDITIDAKGEPVIGSLVTPDIFDNNVHLSGSITALRSDFSNLVLYDAETEFEIHLKLEEPNTGPPKSFLNFYLPRVKISALSAPVGGADGAKVETLTLMIGPKPSGITGYDAGSFTASSSAP